MNTNARSVSRTARFLVGIAAAVGAMSAGTAHALTAPVLPPVPAPVVRVLDFTNRVGNPSFEQPRISGAHSERTGGSTLGTCGPVLRPAGPRSNCWTVGGGGVALLDAGYWRPAEGLQSLELRNVDNSAVVQAVSLRPATTYLLSARVSHNPNAAADPLTLTARQFSPSGALLKTTTRSIPVGEPSSGWATAELTFTTAPGATSAEIVLHASTIWVDESAFASTGTGSPGIPWSFGVPGYYPYFGSGTPSGQGNSDSTATPVNTAPVIDDVRLRFYH